MANFTIMNKFLILASLLCSVLSLSSCHDDKSVFNEPSPIRAYETDAQILMQFVEVDETIGQFVINPDKKINASDYFVNRSREELMKVSQFNRDKFINEMKEINSLLYSVKESGTATAIIYSTISSNSVIEGNNNGFITIKALGITSRSGNNVANLIIDSKKCEPTSFYTQKNMTMNLCANSKSQFYLYQLSFGNTTNPSRGIVIISGIKAPGANNSYRIVSMADNAYMTMVGQNLIGNGTLSVSISK